MFRRALHDSNKVPNTLEIEAAMNLPFDQLPHERGFCAALRRRAAFQLVALRLWKPDRQSRLHTTTLPTCKTKCKTTVPREPWRFERTLGKSF